VIHKTNTRGGLLWRLIFRLEIGFVDSAFGIVCNATNTFGPVGGIIAAAVLATWYLVGVLLIRRKRGRR
jgi:hypothetical protein